MRPELIRRARPALGTLVDIAVDVGGGVDAVTAIDAAFDCVHAFEAQLSARREDSGLMQLCAQAHLAPQRVGAALFEVLQQSLTLHRQSEGIFEITRPLAGIDAISGDVMLDEAAGTVFFRRPLRLDLGGIAKGYVIDRVVDVLRKHGVRNACVNGGGDLRVIGDHAEPVALRFADGLRVVAQLRDGAFAASRPGPRPMAVAHEAVDPHIDGRSRAAVPEGDTIAVFAATAMIADALTKIALVCPQTMDRMCVQHAAEWRRYPFDPAPMVAHAA